MKSLKDIECGCFYLLESKSSGRSCYFESEMEIEVFRYLVRVYLKPYVELNKMYLSAEGYQLLVRIKQRNELTKRYRARIQKQGKEPKSLFISEPWRIVSEQMRIMLSLYVRKANKLRGREGVLVKSSYERRYFDDVNELEEYVEEMDKGKEIEGQSDKRYRVSERWKMKVDWERVRGALSDVGRHFHDLVLLNLVEITFQWHNSKKPPNFHQKI